MDSAPLPHEQEHPEDEERIGPLEPVLLKGWAKEPSDRPTVREFLNELRPILDSMHIAYDIPDAQPESQNGVPYVEHAFARHAATRSQFGSSLNTSSPTQATKSYAATAPAGSSACSPQSSIAGVLYQHISHAVNDMCAVPLPKATQSLPTEHRRERICTQQQRYSL